MNFEKNHMRFDVLTPNVCEDSCCQGCNAV